MPPTKTHFRAKDIDCKRKYGEKYYMQVEITRKLR